MQNVRHYYNTKPGLRPELQVCYGSHSPNKFLQRVSIALAMQSAVLAMIDSVCLTV